MNIPAQQQVIVSDTECPLWLRHLVRIVIFLFPITVATVGWGSAIFVLLLFPALYYGRGWSRLSPWERHLLLGYVVVFVAMSLSLLNAEELREGAKALDRYLRFSLIIPIYLMFRRFEFSLGRELVAGAVVACVVMGGQAYYQVQVQGFRIAEGYYHKIVFGDLAVWWAAVAALFAVTLMRGWWVRLMIGLVIVVALYASLLSQTRGAWLFVPLLPVIFLWAQWSRLGSSRYWVIAGVTTLLVVTAGVGTQFDRLKGGFERGIQEIEVFVRKPEAGTSWGIRLNLWRNSLLLLEETPLLGSGVGDFQSDMRRMVADGRSWNPYVEQFNHAHSIYFDTLARGGLFGFLSTVIAILLLPLMAFVRGLRRAEQPWERFYAIGGVMLVAAFATFGLSEGLWTRNPFVNTYVICLVVLLAGMVNSRERAEAGMGHRLS